MKYKNEQEREEYYWMKYEEWKNEPFNKFLSRLTDKQAAGVFSIIGFGLLILGIATLVGYIYEYFAGIPNDEVFSFICYTLLGLIQIVGGVVILVKVVQLLRDNANNGEEKTVFELAKENMSPEVFAELALVFTEKIGEAFLFRGETAEVRIPYLKSKKELLAYIKSPAGVNANKEGKEQ